MKKLNLQLDSIKEMLTKEQMKKIVGGYGGGTKYQCCSDLASPNVHCSDCVEVPAGSTATCTVGTLYAC